MTGADRLEAAIARHTTHTWPPPPTANPAAPTSDAAYMIESLHTRAQRRAERRLR